MVNPNQKVHELLKATSLHKVFDIHKDEASAIHSFGPLATGTAPRLRLLFLGMTPRTNVH
jgi:hypothetical protein